MDDVIRKKINHLLILRNSGNSRLTELIEKELLEVHNITSSDIDEVLKERTMKSEEYKTLKPMVKCPSEDQEMMVLARYLDARFGVMGWIHIQNEFAQHASIGTVMKARRKGVKKGFPDILIFWGTKNDKKGLAIELKKKVGGIVSSEQAQWLYVLNAYGWETALANGADHAVKLINSHYGDKCTVS